jgi:hypothetical protein
VCEQNARKWPKAVDATLRLALAQNTQKKKTEERLNALCNLMLSEFHAKQN